MGVRLCAADGCNAIEFRTTGWCHRHKDLHEPLPPADLRWTDQVEEVQEDEFALTDESNEDGQISQDYASGDWLRRRSRLLGYRQNAEGLALIAGLIAGAITLFLLNEFWIGPMRLDECIDFGCIASFFGYLIELVLTGLIAFFTWGTVRELFAPREEVKEAWELRLMISKPLALFALILSVLLYHQVDNSWLWLALVVVAIIRLGIMISSYVYYAENITEEEFAASDAAEASHKARQKARRNQFGSKWAQNTNCKEEKCRRVTYRSSEYCYMHQPK